MKSKRYLYGLMGLLSLLGFIGVFTEAKSFLGFFAFAVDFEYFFIKSDEMLEEYMNKSASRAFYCGMISVALVSFVCFLLHADKRNNTDTKKIGYLIILITDYYNIKLILHKIQLQHPASITEMLF